jgi:esterase/lipase
MAANDASFEDSFERIRALKARQVADPRLNPDCQSLLFDHGATTRRAVVFLHGITSSPFQFRDLGMLFHSRGYNVFIPTMPYHGYRNRLTHDPERLTTTDYKDYAQDAVTAARGLGEHLTLAGLSVSGVAAAWGAQTLVDVDLAVLIAPAFAPVSLPQSLLPILTRLVTRLPNLFIWWDFKKRAAVGPICSYPRFSTHAMAECFKLGIEISRQAVHTKPASRSILAVTNARDPAVNNATTRALLHTWQSHQSASIRAHQFGPELGRLHDIIGPYQPDAHVDIAYPILFDLIDASA